MEFIGIEHEPRCARADLPTAAYTPPSSPTPSPRTCDR